VAAGPPEPEDGGIPTRLSVVILNWNAWEATRDRASAVSGWPRLRPQVSVVDNRSDGNELSLLRSALPAVRLLDAGTNRGFGGGNNLALQEISTPFVLLLNNDAGIEEEAGSALLDLLERRSDVAVAGPSLVDPADGAEAVGGRDIGRYVRTHQRADEADRGPGREAVDVAYVPGTAALLRTEAIRAVGGFDERFFFSGEMADLCRRLQERGWRTVVAPGVRAWHDRNRDERRRTLDAYYSLRNRFLYLRKHPASGRRWLWVLYATASAARHLARGRPARARAELLALFHGLRGRFGCRHRELGW
jgi:hypothetical protein